MFTNNAYMRVWSNLPQPTASLYKTRDGSIYLLVIPHSPMIEGMLL